MSRLVHPRMITALQQDFFLQSCALQEPATSQDTAGAETSAYTTRAGYESIPCRVGMATGGERRTNLQAVYLDATHKIVLKGQFHDVTETWKALVDGQAYDILLATADPEGAMTSLLCRIVR